MLFATHVVEGKSAAPPSRITRLRAAIARTDAANFRSLRSAEDDGDCQSRHETGQALATFAFDIVNTKNN